MLARAAEATWASVAVPDVDVLFYFGGRRSRTDGRSLQLPVPDGFAHIGEKTIACFEHALANSDFDLVFRTNCSSYVDLPNMRKFLVEHARKEGFYAGVLDAHDSVPFASGSGYFLSRDLVETVVRDRHAWDHSLLDDVALGLVLAKAGIVPVATPRVDYASPLDVIDVDTSQFHFRCKTLSPRRLDDVEIMLRLHRVFCQARGWRPPRVLSLDWRLGQVGRHALRFVRR
jgi:hypothetical protein